MSHKINVAELLKEITEAAILNPGLPTSYKEQIMKKADIILKVVEEVNNENKALRTPAEVLPGDEGQN